MDNSIKNCLKLIEILENVIQTEKNHIEKDILELYNELLLREYCFLEKNLEYIFPNEM